MVAQVGKSFFKGPRVTEKVRRRRKREARDKRTRDNKEEVRQRDRKCTRRGCRFPLCGCHQFKVPPGVNTAIEVSHLQHQGMGGNPKEDRNAPDKLIAVCGHRHKDGRIAIDKGTLQCRPLTTAGTDGPVSWWVSVEDLMNTNVVDERAIDGWLKVAEELEPGVLRPLEEWQQEILEFLAQLTF